MLFSKPKGSRAILFVLAFFHIFLLVEYAYAQTSLKTARQGVFSIESTENGRLIYSQEAQGKVEFVRSKDLPLQQLRKNRPDFKIRNIVCVQPPPETRCLVYAAIGDKREMWLTELRIDTGKWNIIPLPSPRSVYGSIFNQTVKSFLPDSPLAYASLSTDQKIILNVEDQIDSDKADRGFYRKELAVNETAIARPVYRSNSIKAIFLILAKQKSQKLVRAKDAVEAVIFLANGNFEKVDLPANCLLLGVISDKLLCAPENGRATATSGNQPYPIVYVTSPSRNVANLFGRADNIPFHAIHNFVIMNAVEDGIQTPFVYNINTNSSHWLFDPKTRHCLDRNVHIKSAGVTHKQDGILVGRFGPLSPPRLDVFPFDGSAINACSSPNRSLRKGKNEFDSSSFGIERLHKPEGGIPPYVLIKGRSTGPLSGKLLIKSYANAGAIFSENYVGPWGKYWLDRGGNIVVPHLPGGGGYGAAWIKAGSGINGKVSAADSLNNLADHLIASGKADYGKISLISGSAGGPVISYAALLEPLKYEAVLLRAACLDIEIESSHNCRRNNSYGDRNNPEDVAVMRQFTLTDRINGLKQSPTFIFMIPQYDTLVKRKYQLRMAQSIKDDRKQILYLNGVKHTERLPAKREEMLVRDIAAYLSGDTTTIAFRNWRTPNGS